MPYLVKPSKTKSRTFNRDDRQKIYQSARWKRLRLAKLMKDPLCEHCLKEGRTTLAIDCHHKDSFMNYTGLMRLQKAYDIDNLVSLCKEHHAQEHLNGTTHG